MTALRAVLDARVRRAVFLLRRARRVSFEGLVQRVARRAYRRTGAAALEEQLPASDVAEPGRFAAPAPERRPERGMPLTVGWVISPPALGSGGHTTMFRMVAGLEAAGHRCVLLLHDRYGVDVGERAATIREGWPEVRAEVRDLAGGMRRLDACVATSWETAHALATHGDVPMRRLYFIQDYEPFFYPRGSDYELAAMTYRFGFRNIALGEMVRGCLVDELGLHPDLVPFGCDTDTYHVLGRPRERRGVVLYAKPDTARRGYRLAALALRDFHARHPEEPIHVYGSRPRDLDVPIEFHGRLVPAELNELYQGCIAGLAMSFTNISLVAEEMLAAGVVPVVNDSPLSRADLDHPAVRWAPATPAGIADALSDAVGAPDLAAQAAAAAAGVRRSWGPARDGVLRIIEDEVYGPDQGGHVE